MRAISIDDGRVVEFCTVEELRAAFDAQLVWKITDDYLNYIDTDNIFVYYNKNTSYTDGKHTKRLLCWATSKEQAEKDRDYGPGFQQVVSNSGYAQSCRIQK